MRALGVVLLLTVFSSAEPPRPAIKAGPSKVIEAPAWEPPARPTTKVPGMTGADSTAIVIDPGAHADARPWPHGIVIRPPETGDHNVIELGSSDLPASTKLSVRLGRTLDHGLGQFLEWLLTPRFVRRI